MAHKRITTLSEPEWNEARNAAASIVSVLPRELVSLAQCVDRTLAGDLFSLVDLPSYETSAMDGYAVAGAGPWKIVGDVKAGAPMKQSLTPGTAVRIATGAVVPEGAFGILRSESASINDDVLKGELVAGEHIRPAGLECRRGEVIASAGTVLSPAWIGLLASAGFDAVDVVRKPRIEILLFGDEIQLQGIPSDGLVRDSLGPQIPAWLSRMGADVVAMSYVTDEISLVIEAIAQACLRADVVITTGGTAAGPRDHLHGALEALGGVLVVDKVKVRPGHPMLLARIETVPLLGLPGNPQSAIVALMTLGQPLFNALLGRSTKALDSFSTKKGIKIPEGFTRLVLGNLRGEYFEESDYLGSAMLRGLAQSSGFAVAVGGSGEAGSTVLWLPLP